METDLKWLAIDFDNTLARSLWTPENRTSDIGEPIWENLAKLDLAVAHGYKVIIHTARPSTDVAILEAWLDKYHVPFRGITTGKILTLTYIDDKAVHESAASWVPGVGGHCVSCTCGKLTEKVGSHD